MTFNFLALAIPFFGSLVLLEYHFARRKQLKTHQFGESIANLNVGIAERMTDIFTSSLFIFFYTYLHTNYALFSIESNVFTWILLFLATDFIWYWYHRWGHEINIFWAAHIVHHQSEDFNFTAATRITCFQALVRGTLWGVLPVLGFPPEMITLLLLIHGTYPFFTHTTLIGNLGWLEYVFVTPSHHRVHHSINEKYLDKNYGDILIIWDKLFGTFQKEEEMPIYGITKPLKSHSFLWQHFHYFLELYLAVASTKGLSNKLKLLFGKPVLISPVFRKHLERLLFKNKSHYSTSLLLKRYVLIQTNITLLIAFSTILLEKQIASIPFYLIFCIVILSLINTGAILEQKRWVFHVEFLRIVFLIVLITHIYPHMLVLLTLSSLLLIISAFYKTLSGYYTKMLFT